MEDHSALLALGSAAGSWLLKTVLDRVFGKNKDLDDIRAELRSQSDRVARIEADAQKNEALFRKDVQQIEVRMNEWFTRMDEQLKEIKQDIGHRTVRPARLSNRKTS